MSETQKQEQTYRVDVTVILPVRAGSKAQATKQAQDLVCTRMSGDNCIVEWTGVEVVSLPAGARAMANSLTPSSRPVAGEETLYPCITPGCTAMRTKAEGGTTFSVCDDCWDKLYPPKDSVPSGEGMPESEVERDARYRLDRYSGGVRQWEVWPKDALASRRMDLRIVLHRLKKTEREIVRLTREQATRTAALAALREAVKAAEKHTATSSYQETAYVRLPEWRDLRSALSALLGGDDA